MKNLIMVICLTTTIAIYCAFCYGSLDVERLFLIRNLGKVVMKRITINLITLN